MGLLGRGGDGGRGEGTTKHQNLQIIDTPVQPPHTLPLPITHPHTHTHTHMYTSYRTEVHACMHSASLQANTCTATLSLPSHLSLPSPVPFSSCSASDQLRESSLQTGPTFSFTWSSLLSDLAREGGLKPAGIIWMDASDVCKT